MNPGPPAERKGTGMRIDSGPSKATAVWWVFVLVVTMTVVVGILFVARRQVQRVPRKAITSDDIQNLMTALITYYGDFGAYPPGGMDLNDNGNLDDPGDDYGSGHIPADPAHPKATELQLRSLCSKFIIDNGTRTAGPWYAARPSQIDPQGRLCDTWGRPLRYLSDGRRKTTDPKTGQPLPGRVDRRPVIWSVGPDGKQDPKNNNLDDNDDNKVDDPGELVDDICSWN